MVTDPPGGDRGHRLIEHAHAFRDATAHDESLTEKRERLDLEVHVTEAARNRQRRDGQLLALGRVTRERSVQERQPAVRRTLLDPLEHARGALLPAQADAEVAVVGDVHERQPDRVVRRGRELPGARIQLERPLLQLDRAVVLAIDHRDLAQPGQRLGTLPLLEHTLKTDPRPVPVGGGNRLIALAEQGFPRLNLHRRRSSHSGHRSASEPDRRNAGCRPHRSA